MKRTLIGSVLMATCGLVNAELIVYDNCLTFKMKDQMRSMTEQYNIRFKLRTCPGDSMYVSNIRQAVLDHTESYLRTTAQKGSHLIKMHIIMHEMNAVSGSYLILRYKKR